MKILLINPPSHVPTTVPPTGLCYVSSVLKQKGHEVTGIDATALNNKLTVAQVVQQVKAIKPDLVGISLNIYFIKGGYRLAKELSRLGIPLVAGGPHVHVRPQEVLAEGFDYAVTGEGEETVLELIDSLEGRRDINAITGLGFRDRNGQIRINEPRKLIEDLDSIPFLDRELFPISDYLAGSAKDRENFLFPFFTSRGCPYQCTYCVLHLRRTLRRSVGNVLEEMQALKTKYQVSKLVIFDDLFTINRKWLFELFDGMKSRNLEFDWQCESRVDTLDKDMAIRMKDAGCSCLWFGIESGDKETLEKINKKISLEQIRKTMDFIAKLNFGSIKINFILGFPWEKKAHIDNSFKLIKEYSKTVKARSGIAVPIPYPGSKLYDDYHEDYGFKEWWLRDNVFEDVTEKPGQVPYFKQNQLFAFQTRFWLEVNFFKYPPGLKRYIKKVVVKSEKLIYYGNFGFFKTEFIYYLSYLSYLLYGLNPGFERGVFRILKSFKSLLCKNP